MLELSEGLLELSYCFVLPSNSLGHFWPFQRNIRVTHEGLGGMGDGLGFTLTILHRHARRKGLRHTRRSVSSHLFFSFIISREVPVMVRIPVATLPSLAFLSLHKAIQRINPPQPIAHTDVVVVLRHVQRLGGVPTVRSYRVLGVTVIYVIERDGARRDLSNQDIFILMSRVISLLFPDCSR